MKPHHNGHDTDVELDMLALRYVTGELTTSEIEMFEARLADDQEVRESVSRAVAIGMAAARQPRLETIGVASPSVEGPSNGDAMSSRFGWRRLAAAVLIIGVGLAFYFNRDISTPETLPTDQDLIASWGDFHDLPDSGDIVVEHEMFGNASGAIELESSLDFGAETPSWMVLVLAK